MPPRKKLASKTVRSKKFPKIQTRIQIKGDDHKIKKSKNSISNANKNDQKSKSSKNPLKKHTIEKILEDFGCDADTSPQKNDHNFQPMQNTSTPAVRGDPKHAFLPRKLSLKEVTPPKIGQISQKNEIEKQSQLLKRQFSHISKNLVNVSNMMEKITFSNLDKTNGERASGSENTLNSENEESFNRFIDASDSFPNQYLSSYPENPPELHKTPLNINSILNKDNSVFLSNELMSPREIDPPLSSTLSSPKTTSKTENSNFFDDESLFYSQSRFSKHSRSPILSNLPTNQTNPIQLINCVV